MVEDFMVVLKDAHRRVQETNHALRPYQREAPTITAVAGRETRPLPAELKIEIHKALMDVSKPLADSYEQVYLDLANSDQLAWAGTVHLVREILSQMLRTLAPDKDVKAQAWFASEVGNGRPSQRQRAKYILKCRGAGSTESELVEQNFDLVDEKIGSLVRSTYTRASVAAHGTKGRTKVVRILRYFEAFTHDLLDLP